jgi:hypothetical protein
VEAKIEFDAHSTNTEHGIVQKESFSMEANIVEVVHDTPAVWPSSCSSQSKSSSPIHYKRICQGQQSQTSPLQPE